MKEGRGREYPPYGGMSEELAYLHELRRRAWDLVEDLPPEILDAESHGHSIRQLWEHLLRGECNWLAKLGGMEQPPAVSSIDELETFTDDVFRRFDLDAPFAAEPFSCAGQVMRHLQWHWTYHTAQIGLLRRAAGERYKWTFA